MSASPAAANSPRDALPNIELKNWALAALLAWLVPGAGHYYQGRLFKAALFFVLIMGTFAVGVCLGGSDRTGWGRVVYIEWKKPSNRLFYYVCQSGAGVVAMPALVQSYLQDKQGRSIGNYMAPPIDDDQLNDLHFELGRYFELGTVYTMIAGLLNILAIYDAAAGPVIIIDEKSPKSGGNDPPPTDGKKPPDAAPSAAAPSSSPASDSGGAPHA